MSAGQEKKILYDNNGKIVYVGKRGTAREKKKWAFPAKAQLV